MDNHSENWITQKKGRPIGLIYGLITVAVVICIITLGGLFSGVFLLRHQDYAHWASLAAMLACLLVTGLLAGGLIMFLVYLVRTIGRAEEKLASLDQQASIIAEQSVISSPAGHPAAKSELNSQEWRELMGEIRDILLLPEQERLQRYQDMLEAELQQHKSAAEKFISSRDFHRAREEMDIFVKRFGANERSRDILRQIDASAEAARVNDISQATKRIDDMMGLCYFDDAERLANKLISNYPGAEEPQALLERVLKERSIFKTKHRQRMHDEIEEHVQQHRWREALQSAYRFLESYSTGPDSDVLRAQMPTLEANADIEARQEMEKQIKECISTHQYVEALGLAKKIIADHPLSPQANVLRGQLTRLEELVRTQQNA